MKNHSPEPWTTAYYDGCNEIEIQADVEPLCVATVPLRRLAQGDPSRNAARIAACVNFCEGTSNENLDPGGLCRMIFETDALRQALQNLLTCIHDNSQSAMRLVGIVSDQKTHDAIDAARTLCVKEPQRG